MTLTDPLFYIPSPVENSDSNSDESDQEDGSKDGKSSTNRVVAILPTESMFTFNSDNYKDKAPSGRPKKRSRSKKNKTPYQDAALPVPENSTDPFDVNGLPVPETPTTKPTINNYKELAEDWSDVELQHYLQCAKATSHSRIPPTILTEARALENELTTRLKVLSLAGGVTYETLRYAVLSKPFIILYQYIRLNLLFLQPSYNTRPRHQALPCVP